MMLSNFSKMGWWAVYLSALLGTNSAYTATTTVNDLVFQIARPGTTSVNTGAAQFRVAETFTPAAELGGSDNRYEWTVTNLTADKTANFFSIANPDNLARTYGSPAGWSPRIGAQSFVWDGASNLIGPGGTVSGFFVLTPGILPDMTTNGGDFPNNGVAVITADPDGLRFDFFGPMARSPLVATVVSIPGATTVAEETSIRASSTTSTPSIQQSAVGGLLTDVGTRIRGRLQAFSGFGTVKPDNLTGMNAGDADGIVAQRLWANISARRFENDFVSTALESEAAQLLVGYDVVIADKFLLGVLGGYERQEVETRFNLGSQDIDQVQVVAYTGYLLDSRYSFAATLGYAPLHIEQKRTQPFVGLVTSDLDAWRLFGSFSANADYELGPTYLGLSATVAYAKDRADDFVESQGLHNPSSTVRLGFLRLGADIVYPVAAWSFFAGAGFVYDFKRTPVVVGPSQPRPEEDRTELDLSLGVRYNLSDQASAEFEYATTLQRDNVDEDSLSFTVSIAF
jgi:outer membrane autotransporter protein